MTRFDVLPCEFDRIMRAPSRPKAEAERAERRVEDRREHLKQRLLDQAINDVRNP